MNHAFRECCRGFVAVVVGFLCLYVPLLYLRVMAENEPSQAMAMGIAAIVSGCPAGYLVAWISGRKDLRVVAFFLTCLMVVSLEAIIDSLQTGGGFLGVGLVVCIAVLLGGYLRTQRFALSSPELPFEVAQAEAAKIMRSAEAEAEQILRLAAAAIVRASPSRHSAEGKLLQCRHCGKAIQDTNNFCANCGTHLLAQPQIQHASLANKQSVATKLGEFLGFFIVMFLPILLGVSVLRKLALISAMNDGPSPLIISVSGAAVMFWFCLRTWRRIKSKKG